LLNHVNAILDGISWGSPAAAVHKNPGAAFIASEFKSPSDLLKHQAHWPAL